MPTRKSTASVKSSSNLAPKPKKKSPPPPSPHEKAPREKPHKPGKKHAVKPHKPEKKHAEQEDKPRGKHLRRVYEHLGRVEALQSFAEVESVPFLVRLAQSSIDQGEAHSAADLLRAAEHLGFAAAAAKSGSGQKLSPDLEEAIRREFRKLLEAAEDPDLTRNSTLGVLLRETLANARSAFDASNFRQALELARAAESLAEIDPEIANQYDQPRSERTLES